MSTDTDATDGPAWDEEHVWTSNPGVPVVASSKLAYEATNAYERPAHVCDTPCDSDCEEPCHEVHVVGWRRTHEPPENGPALSLPFPV